MSSLKASLKSAKECLARGDPKEALQHCKAALKADKSAYETYLLIGKAAFLLKEHGQSELAYRKATELNSALSPAWKGLVELYSATQEDAQLIDALVHLLSQAESSDGPAKQQEHRRRLAELYQKQGQHAKAAALLQELLDQLDKSEPSYLSALCQLADAQAELQRTGSDVEGASSLQEIVQRTAPDARYGRYHEAWVARQLAGTLLYAAGSSEWLTAAKAVLHKCLSLVGNGQSCCTWGPYEAALSIPEQLASVPGEDLTEIMGPSAEAALERASLELAHKFPWRPSAVVARATILHRRMLAAATPSKLADRRRLAKVLQLSILESQNSSRAWQIAAELNLQSWRPTAAMALSVRGLELLRPGQQAGDPWQFQVVSRLRLAQAEAHLMLQHTDHAEVAFRALAEETKAERGAAWAEEQRRLSLTGMAACALAKRDLGAAKTLFRHLLAQGLHSGSLKGQLQSNYGWTLFLQGEGQEARTLLEDAVAELQAAGGSATDGQLGEAHLRLGRTYWALGGNFRADRKYAHKSLLAAAATEGPSQGAAFAWLGTFYLEIAGDEVRAQRCFQRALALDPQQATAGEGLCKMLRQSGGESRALQLCQEVTSRAPAARWAWNQLGRLLLRSGQVPQAVTALQTGLRGAGDNADAWEALGAAYQSLGRLTAATKAYRQATSLEPGRLFSWVQSGSIQLSLGATADALADFDRALHINALHLPALLGAAQALLASAQRHISYGALGLAAKELASAEQRAVGACAQGSKLRSAWKLLGDIRIAHHGVNPPMSAPATQNGLPSPSDAVAQWHERVGKVLAARRAYATALHLAPHAGLHWGDAAASFSQQAELLRAHPALGTAANPQLLGQAERLLKGGLQLEPRVAPMWAALGSTAASLGVREYALSRALQLDPKLVTAWTALGRLYTEAGETALAGRCFASARSHEPTAAVVWEGMGALAASSATGKSERMDYYEHAVRLGSGKEALLGFVEGALKRKRGHQAAVFVAACSSVARDPLNAAAHASKGLVLECRGDNAGAAEALQHALSLLQPLQPPTGSGPQSQAGVTAVAMPNGTSSHDHSVYNSQRLCQANLTSNSDLGSEEAIQMNLGRVLTKAGRYKEAAAVFDFMQRLDDKPAVLLAFGQALLGAGSAAAAERTFLSALKAQPQPQVHAELVVSLCRLHISKGAVGDAAQLLDVQMQTFLANRTPSEAMGAALLTVLAGAARRGSEQDLAAVGRVCSRFSALAQDAGGAEFGAAQMAIRAKAAAARGQAQQASRLALRALYLAPWQPALRAEAGTAAIMADGGSAPAAWRLCSSHDLCGPHATAPRTPSQCQDAATQCAVRKAYRARAYASLLQPTSPHPEMPLNEYQALVRRVHSDPLDADAWTFASLLAGPAGVGQESTAARLLIETAAAVCGSLESTQQATLLHCTFAERYLQSASAIACP